MTKLLIHNLPEREEKELPLWKSVQLTWSYENIKWYFEEYLSEVQWNTGYENKQMV